MQIIVCGKCDQVIDYVVSEKVEKLYCLCKECSKNKHQEKKEKKHV
jgi:hypothetical protein